MCRYSLVLVVFLLAATVAPAAQDGEAPPAAAATRHGHGKTSEAAASAEDVRVTSPAEAAVVVDIEVNCKSALLPGQFLCTELLVDEETQQPRGCNRDTGTAAAAPCVAAPGFVCKETGNSTFFRDVACKWTNGYDFETALLLSVFLGMFGADRFYLGYPAIGLLKFSTLGFFFLGHLLDIVLIAAQVVGPADGSHYIISYFGPGISIVGVDEETARRPMSDWF